MTRPIRLDIDLSAIRHNYLVSRAQTAGRRAYAVIKADAYGHGSLEVAHALADVADGFALLNIEDAIRLRRAGIRQPMTLLEGAFDLEETVLMAEHGIAGAVHSPHQIDLLARLDSDRPVADRQKEVKPAEVRNDHSFKLNPLQKKTKLSCGL